MKKSTYALMAIGVAVLINGCMSNKSDIALDDRSMTDEELCKKYSDLRKYNIKGDNIKQVLTENKKIDKEDWDLIEDYKIRKGMTKLAVGCAYGEPYYASYNGNLSEEAYVVLGGSVKVYFEGNKVMRWK